MPQFIMQKIVYDDYQNIITTEITEEEEALFRTYVNTRPPISGFYRYHLISDKGNLSYDSCVSYLLDYIKDVK